MLDWLIGNGADIGKALVASEGLNFLKFTSAAYEAKRDMGFGFERECGFKQRIERMARAVIARVHDHKLFAEPMFGSKAGAAFRVIAHELVVRPRRNDG